MALARELERRHPELITADWWKEERGERVFVDFNQNAPHKTVFGAWFARPRVGGQVSTPLAWDEIETVDPEALTIRTVPDRLRERGDPWAAIADEPQSLAAPAGHGGARPGRRTARRTVAARVPKATRRAAPGGPEPGQEGLSRWTRSTLSAASPTCSSGTVPSPTRCGPFAHAAAAIADLPVDELAAMSPARLQTIPGVGKTSAQVITEAAGGRRRPYLARSSRRTDLPPMSRRRPSCSTGSRATATATRTGPTAGVPSARWPRRPGRSATATGPSPITAPASPSPTGSTRSACANSSTWSAELNEELAPFRILTGIEVDILEDGSLDQDEELLAQLDVVVASVHSKLRMEEPAMTRRMLRAVESPHTDILGHCTGRILAGRGARRRRFDAEAVFEACAAHRHRGRDQLPARAPRPTRAPARHWPCRSAASWSWTPTPTPRASSSGSATGASRPPQVGVPARTGHERPVRWTTSWPGRLATRLSERRSVRAVSGVR